MNQPGTNKSSEWLTTKQLSKSVPEIRKQSKKLVVVSSDSEEEAGSSSGGMFSFIEGKLSKEIRRKQAGRANNVTMEAQRKPVRRL